MIRSHKPEFLFSLTKFFFWLKLKHKNIKKKKTRKFQTSQDCFTENPYLKKPKKKKNHAKLSRNFTVKMSH